MPTYVTAVSGAAQVPLLITVYDAAGNPLPPASITWTLPPDGSVVVTPMGAQVALVSSIVQQTTLTAHHGIAQAYLEVSFTAPGLLFSSP